jgi:hypothetical protein
MDIPFGILSEIYTLNFTNDWLTRILPLLRIPIPTARLETAAIFIPFVVLLSPSA